ncbi:MAG TPA: LysM domain-containing protein [Solirubrobacter sp.]
MRRNPARFLAPIALIAFSFALYSLVQDGRDKTNGNSSGNATATATATSTSKKKSSSSAKKKRKTYTVKSGDTLSGIAEKTGVSLETLNELNPNADTLSPGQKLRLSR